MNLKEAQARIKINKLLEESGWHFFDSAKGKATIKLESSIKMEDLGEDFEDSKNGFIDFLLVDENQNPLLVLEAKKESPNPLGGKEQARNYATLAVGNWSTFLNNFLQLSSYPILNDRGKITMLEAKLKAEMEFDKHRIIQDKNYELDFDKKIKK